MVYLSDISNASDTAFGEFLAKCSTKPAENWLLRSLFVRVFYLFLAAVRSGAMLKWSSWISDEFLLSLFPTLLVHLGSELLRALGLNMFSMVHLTVENLTDKTLNVTLPVWFIVGCGQDPFRNFLLDSWKDIC